MKKAKKSPVGCSLQASDIGDSSTFLSTSSLLGDQTMEDEEYTCVCPNHA